MIHAWIRVSSVVQLLQEPALAPAQLRDPAAAINTQSLAFGPSFCPHNG
jgi:hypothetical protein